MALIYLFVTYGVVLTEEVKEQENKIRSMTFHPTDLLIMLYRKIENLQKLVVAARISYTPKHFLDIGIIVIKNNRDFECALMTGRQNCLKIKTGPTSSLISLQHRKCSRRSEAPPCCKQDIIMQTWCPLNSEVAKPHAMMR